MAPGGLVPSSPSTALTSMPRMRSTQSSDAVPTMAGMARSHWPDLPVETLKPAASPEVTSSSRCTRQPSVVPTMSRASPSVPGQPMPEPNPHAGKSNGPELTGVPAGSPSRAAPSACSSATGTGATIGASNERRSVSPVSSSTRSL